MKMVKKVIAVCAALSTAAAMSSLAFAGSLTATYNAQNNTVTAVPQGASFSDQITVAVVPENTTTISSDKLYYINQSNDASVLTDMGLLSTIPDGTYEVWVGCSEGEIYKGSFTKGGTPSHPDYPLGDADLSHDITGGDALAVLDIVAGKSASADSKACADADKSGDITGGDALTILDVVAGKSIDW